MKDSQATFCAGEKRKLSILGAIKRAENSVRIDSVRAASLPAKALRRQVDNPLKELFLGWEVRKIAYFQGSDNFSQFLLTRLRKKRFNPLCAISLLLPCAV